MPRDSMDDFTAVYHENFRIVFNFSLRMTGDTHAAEEITQETFVRALSGLAGFRGESAITTWLLSIARNNCFNYLSAQKRRSFAAFEEIIDSAGSPYRDNPDNRLEREEYTLQVKHGCLVGLMNCLPYHQRCAFILCVLNDLPPRDVSVILSRSENAVRILLHRARSALRRFLCANCALFSSGNRCRCENMIHFSLERGLIDRMRSPLSPDRIESELADLRNEILVYKSLPSQSADDFRDKCLAFIKNSDMGIFSRKKVK